MKKIALLLLVASLLSANVAAEETNQPASKVTQIFDRELPNVPGKSMRAVLVEYGPGAASPSHRHPSSAFIYATVLEGEIRSKINDDPEHVYKAGESWTEVPGDHHKVSANASSTKPARLLAIFVVDTAERDSHPGQIAPSLSGAATIRCPAAILTGTLTSSARAGRRLASPSRRTELRRAHRPRGCRGSARASAWTRRAGEGASWCRGRKPPSRAS